MDFLNGKANNFSVRHGNYHITASPPGIRLPDNGQTEISFRWQTGLCLDFSPQA
jgi:hypothetical protein